MRQIEINNRLVSVSDETFRLLERIRDGNTFIMDICKGPGPLLCLFGLVKDGVPPTLTALGTTVVKYAERVRSPDRDAIHLEALSDLSELGL